jgi:hypothetical protein
MKIRLTETINVDPDKWAKAYGIDRKDVREDVLYYFQSYGNLQQERINHLGLAPDKPAD